MDKYITSEIKDKVCYIEFFTSKHNSLTSDMLDELSEKILNVSEEIPVIVLKSGGEKSFCAGANFNELVSINNQSEAKDFFSGFAKVLLAIKNAKQIVIGSIQGKAIGGGVGIIAATDYCFATKYASIKLSEINIGIGPFVIEPAIERKSGLNAFTELTLNPDNFFSSEWALNNRLYSKVTEDIEELNKEVKLYATKLSSYNTLALKEIKKVLWKNTNHWEELLSERAKISGNLVLQDSVQKKLKSMI
jgi:methylglutaconyl-CoA hydratase